MSRMSTDELAPDGTILNGFDYNAQVWVRNGLVQCCDHPPSRRVGSGGLEHGGLPCCPAWRLAGQRITDIPGHEVRGRETP